MKSQDELTLEVDDRAEYRAGYDAGWTDGRAAERAILELPPRHWWTRP